MFKLNAEDNNTCAEVRYPTFGFDLIVDSEHENLPSFDEVMMDTHDDDTVVDLDSFDPLETAISVLGMNGTEQNSKNNSPSKPRIGPASFKKKQEEQDSPKMEIRKPMAGPASAKKRLLEQAQNTSPEKPPSAFDLLRTNMSDKLDNYEKPVPRAGPASFKRRLDSNSSSTSEKITPKIGPARFKKSQEDEETPPSSNVSEKATPRIGPASFKRKQEKDEESSDSDDKPVARAGPASSKRKLDEDTPSSAAQEKSIPKVGPASFKRKLEEKTAEKPAPRIGPASFKRKLDDQDDSPSRSRTRERTPVREIPKPQKSAPRAGPARFTRKVMSDPLATDENSNDSVTTTDPLVDISPEPNKKTEKRPQRAGPARFKNTIIEISDEDSSHSIEDLDSSNIKSLTLGLIPIKKGGAVAVTGKRKSRSPDRSQSVTCESCNIKLPSLSALRAHDRATHKPSRIAQHLKVKAQPRRSISKVPKYNDDSDFEEDKPAVSSGSQEVYKCYKCMKVVSEEDYIAHLVGHDSETQAEMDTANSTANLSQGAKLIRRYVFADVNDERNKSEEAVLRCFLCTNFLFLNREDFRLHTETKHNIIMENYDDGASD